MAAERWRWGLFAGPCILAACGASREPVQAAPSSSPTLLVEKPRAVDAGNARASSDAGEPRPACARAQDDARTSSEDFSERERPYGDPLDVNGDGTPDCVFSNCHGANCTTRIYVVEADAPRLVGEMATSFLAAPFCVREEKRRPFCRLRVSEHMIHGEEQEYFYDYVGTSYVKTESGRLIGGPRRKK